MPKSLIISPQAGLGNRMRTISSAIVLAKQSRRKIYHAWHPIIPNEKRPQIVPLQKYGYEEFFMQDYRLPLATKEIFPNIGLCFSEWATEDYWYKFQNNAQQEFHVGKYYKDGSPANSIYRIAYDTILLETALPVRLDMQYGGCKTDEDFNNELHKAYGLLTPQPKYISLLDKFDSIDVGISIRRGDLLKYSPEANQDLGKLKEWILDIAKEQSIVIFSDDSDVRKLMEDAIPNYNHGMNKLIQSLPSHQSAFMQFLYLAKKCSIIYGTPGSSFAKEASIFGGKKYFDNLTKNNHNFPIVN